MKNNIITTVIALILTSQLVFAGSVTDTYTAGDTLTAKTMNNIKAAVNDNNDQINLNVPDIAALIADVNDLKTQIGSIKSGIAFTKLHAADELGLKLGGTISTDIGSVANIKGLLLEWRMKNRPEVFQQFIYLTDFDKDVILGNIATPSDYPRRYTIIVSDSFGTMMWLGVSITGSTLSISTNSVANAEVFLERIYSFE